MNPILGLVLKLMKWNFYDEEKADPLNQLVTGIKRLNI